MPMHPALTRQPPLAAGIRTGAFGAAAQPVPSRAAQPALRPSAPPPAGSAAGIRPGGPGLSQDEILSRQGASQAASAAAGRQRQTEMDSTADRNRAIQQERDMAAAHRQNALNNGGTASGEYGYAYAPGGGSSGGRGTGGGGATPEPSQWEIDQRAEEQRRYDAEQRRLDARDAYDRQPVDLSKLAALRNTLMPPEPVETRGAPVNNAVSDQAFARAKDKAGLLALRRMADSRSEFAQRGLTGGGAEAGAMDAVLGDASSGLQDFALGQAQTEAARGNAVEDRNYAGRLTRRGQDQASMNNILSVLGQRSRLY